MTVLEIMEQLRELGSEQTKKIFAKHGAKEPFFGVKVGDMKTIQKKVKANHEIAMELYETGNGDAMYLAGLIAEPKKMTQMDLQHWAELATWQMISEYTVAWVAAEGNFGWEMGMQWIDNEAESIASSGWATLASCLALVSFQFPPESEILNLLTRIEQNIYTSPNRVRYTMNGFVVAVGSYYPTLTEKAKEVAEKIGEVKVEMNGTSCKVPDAKAYIEKIEAKGGIGKRKKMVRC